MTWLDGMATSHMVGWHMQLPGWFGSRHIQILQFIR
jgi:hypothetical protein